MKKPPQRCSIFQERLAFSNGHAPDPDSVFSFLKHRIPDFNGVEKALNANDRAGCDYKIYRLYGPILAIDLKLRSTDYSVMPPPHFADDLALETFNVIETGKIGWTRDSTKNTDYVLWFWKPTGRFFIVPFPALCCVFQRYWQQWRAEYGGGIDPRTGALRPPIIQETKDPGRRLVWHSEHIYVPRSVVVDCIGRWSSGFSKLTGTEG